MHIYVCVCMCAALFKEANASVIIIRECSVIKTLTCFAWFSELEQRERPEERILMVYLRGQLKSDWAAAENAQLAYLFTDLAIKLGFFFDF